MNNLNQYVHFIETLADAAGVIARHYFRSSFKVDVKQDSSPVTQADREIEAELRKRIKETYPTHGIIGEEFGNEDEKAEYVWSLDPIDGTKAFIIGRPTFGTLISLSHKGKPVLGMIDQPISRERWLGINGQGARHNRSLIHTRSLSFLSEAVISTTGPEYFTEAQNKLFLNVVRKARQVVYGGDCYNYGLLALGALDVVIEAGLKPHDYLALIPVIEEAGGIITDWQGNPPGTTQDGHILACGSEAVHKEVLGYLQR